MNPPEEHTGVAGSPMLVAECIGLASLSQPTMSMDGTWPGETILHTAGWQATALSAWREYRIA